MEVGFHFIAEHKLIRQPYDLPILRKFFQALLADGPPRLRTFIHTGDLGLHSLAEGIQISVNGLSHEVVGYDPEAWKRALDEWMAPEEWPWSHRPNEAWGQRIFVVHLAECPGEVALKLDRGLGAWPPYVGARRILSDSPIYPVYIGRLLRQFFMSGAHIRRLSDGDPDEDPDRALLDFLNELPFASVGRAYIPTKEDEDRLDDILGLA